MDNHLEDIQKLDEILKLESENTFEAELQDILNYNISDEEHLDGYDTDSSFDLDISENGLLVAESSFFNIDTLKFSTDLSLIKHYLTPEEIRIINSCKETKLKRLLLLNRAKNIHLKATQRKLYEKLKECTEAILKSREQITKSRKTTDQCNKTVLSRLGFPFFKTKDMFYCPPNADTIQKKFSKEICIDYLPMQKQWTLEDQIILKRSICFNYTNSKIKEYEQKLDIQNALKLETKEAEVLAKVNSDSKECQRYIEKWSHSNTQDIPPLNYDNCDWKGIAQGELKGRHSSFACKAMWTMIMHPSINKSQWSKEEDEKILEIGKTYRFQNWNKIAEDLNTNRTAFTVCAHFFSVLHQKYSNEKFEPEEDKYLQEVVNLCRVGNYIPWAKVAQHFDKRNRNQLYARYKCHLSLPQHKKGGFSEEEDILLLVLVKRFGSKFSRMSEFIPYRSRVQIQHRIKNYLLYDELKHGGWSICEDTNIMKHVEENGPKNWNKLIAQMPLRNSGQIRHRYCTIQTWLSKQDGKTLQDIPRKEFQTKCEMDLPLLKQFADMFEDSEAIPTLSDVKAKLKNCGYKRSQRKSGHYFNSSVDDELLQHFQSSHKLRTAKVVSKSDFKTITATVKSLLALLKVTLTVPDQASLHSNPLLDHVDREILSDIFHNVYVQYNNSTLNLTGASTSTDCANKQNILKIDYKMNDDSVVLIPPNINTLIGMRSMLIKYSAFKTKLTNINKAGSYNKAKRVIEERISLELSNYPVSFQPLIIMERDDFKDRLKILFKWPAIMSLIQPQLQLTILDELTTIKQVANKNIAARGRPKKDYSKIILMNKSRMLKQVRAKTNSASQDIIQHISSVKQECNDLNSVEGRLMTSNKKTEINVITKIVKQPMAADKPKSLEAAPKPVEISEFGGVNPRKKIKLMDETTEDIKSLEADIMQLDGILGAERNDECNIERK